MRVLEKITGTAGAYVLTGTVSVDDRGQYVARAAAHRLASNASRGTLRAVATRDGGGPNLEAIGISPPEARRELCVLARAQLGAPVTSFVWRPVLAIAPTGRVRMRVVAR